MSPEAHVHPASRLLLVYAACLAAMLVIALSVAAMRNAPAAAEAESGRTSVPAVSTAVEAKAR